MHRMRKLIHLVEHQDIKAGLELMRHLSDQQGEFTPEQLIAALTDELRLPPRQAEEFAFHLIDRFTGMLQRTGTGGYRLRNVPPTMAPQMELLRSLANRPRR